MQTNATVVLIAPNETRRRLLTRMLEAQHAVVCAVQSSYPSYAAFDTIAALDVDVYLVELDSNLEQALDLIEALCARNQQATMMAYVEQQRADLVVASMRAGARELLSERTPPNIIGDALLRAAARRTERTQKKTRGKALMFLGAKGGSGVTTLATNFAIALHEETRGEVALLDLNPQLGDIGVLLGLTPRFTLAEALANSARLDEEFVSTLVTQHRSGISVVAAPDVYTPLRFEEESVVRLIDLLANRFPYTVIDAGLRLGNSVESLFNICDRLYLITQVDIPSLRNSERFISHLRHFSRLEVELVLNRFEPRKMDFDLDRLKKALGLEPKWRIPNDYSAVLRAANTGTPLIAEKSAIAQAIYQLARGACGKQPAPEKRGGFRIFGALGD